MQITRLNSREEVREVIKWHNENSEYVVLDTETTGLDYFRDRLLLIVLSGICGDESAIVFDPSFVTELNQLKTPIVAHNFKFDFHFLHKYTVDLTNNQVRDTMLLHHLLDENKSHRLDDLVKEYYGTSYKEQFWSKYKRFEDAGVAEQDQYAGSDVIYTGKIYSKLRAELETAGIPYSLIVHIHDLAVSLYYTELYGVKVDLNYLVNLGIKLKVELENLKTRMRTDIETEISIIENRLYLKELDKRKTDKGKEKVKIPLFNFDSSLQLQELLYDVLHLPVQMSKERRPTVDDAALGVLEGRHPFITLLRDYRGTQKVYTSFIEGTIEKLHNGRIYPSFNVNGTVTGRISSSEPNMQQLPRSGGVRGVFIPQSGYVFLACDYKQLEVTLAAHFSLDYNLLKVVKDNESLHDITAKALDISRQQAKSVNFAVQYGAGAHKISKLLSCSYAEAEKALRTYWDTYNGLKSVIDELHVKVQTAEPIVSPYGRQRRFPKEFGNKWELERAQRQAFNSLVQGTGADLTNRAFHIVSKELSNLTHGRGLFVVHDEIIIEVNKEYVDYWDQRLQAIMVRVGEELGLRVPLSVDSSGAMDRWLD